MASGIAIRNELLDHAFGGSDYTRRGSLYLALLTTAHTSDSGGGTEVSTAVWTNYARLLVDNDGAGTIWSAANVYAKRNSGILNWPSTANITGTPPVIRGWCLYTAASSGSIVAFADFATEETITDGDLVSFGAGMIGIYADNADAPTPSGIAIRNELLDHAFGGSDYTRHGSLYLALLTTAHTSDFGGGTEVSTAVWTNYARLLVDNDGAGTIWSAASGGIKANTAQIDWTSAANITGTSPVIKGWCLYTAASGGSIVAFGKLTSEETVNDGALFSFGSAGLEITFENTP